MWKERNPLEDTLLSITGEKKEKMKGSIHEKDKLNPIETYQIGDFADNVDKLIGELGVQRTIFHLEMIKHRLLQMVIEEVEIENEDNHSCSMG